MCVCALAHRPLHLIFPACGTWSVGRRSAGRERGGGGRGVRRRHAHTHQPARPGDGSSSGSPQPRRPCALWRLTWQPYARVRQAMIKFADDSIFEGASALPLASCSATRVLPLALPPMCLGFAARPPRHGRWRFPRVAPLPCIDGCWQLPASSASAPALAACHRHLSSAPVDVCGGCLFAKHTDLTSAARLQGTTSLRQDRKGTEGWPTPTGRGMRGTGTKGASTAMATCGGRPPTKLIRVGHGHVVGSRTSRAERKAQQAPGAACYMLESACRERVPMGHARCRDLSAAAEAVRAAGAERGARENA